MKTSDVAAHHRLPTPAIPSASASAATYSPMRPAPDWSFARESVFGPVGREWVSVARSTRARRAFRTWLRIDPQFAIVSSVNDAVEGVVSAPNPADRYALSSALLRRAGDCPIAERAMLQAHLPAVRRQARKARCWSGERLRVSYGLVSEMRAGRVSPAVWADLDAIAIAASAEWIRAHAGEDLPMAGLKLRDHVRNRLRSFVWSELRRVNAESILADRPTEALPNPGAELLTLLQSLARDGAVSLHDIQLILNNRLLGVTDRELAATAFVSAATANRMRNRAEARLVLAVGA